MGTDTKITLDEYATTFIRLKTRKLIGKYGFTKSDREDIEQELTLDLLTRLSRFDPEKARSATFVRLVVDRCVASLVRKRKALARDYRRASSLDELIAEDDNENLAELSYDDRNQRDLVIDVAEALDTLPDDLRSIAEGLRNGSTLAEVAREHGCSRGVMRGKVRRIAQHFAERGLAEYISPNQIGRPPRK